MEDELKIAVQKLELVDGDILVVRFATSLSAQARVTLQTRISTMIKRLGKRVEALVLDKGVELTVVRKQPDETIAIAPAKLPPAAAHAQP